MVASMALLLAAGLTGASLAWGQHNQHGSGGHGAAGNVKDDRQLVRFPDALRAHTLANMRDHLLALQEIQEAMARGREVVASRVAEQRLGMSSLGLHGAQEVAKHMPQGMQDIGTQMHRNASRFAIEVQNAGATGDLKPALESLSNVTGACVACHSAYRLQ
jgi:hypothetical protein